MGGEKGERRGRERGERGGFRRGCRFDGERDTESGSLFASRRAARLQRQSVNITTVDAILEHGWFVSPGLKGGMALVSLSCIADESPPARKKQQN